MQTVASGSLIKQIESLVEGEKDFFANAANISAFVYDSLPHLNWVGFYMKTGNELLLAPFKGKTACIRIQIGRGVCGTSAAKAQTIIVPDVNRFEGHIACDPDSRSEIVTPIIYKERVIGVFDVDSPMAERFSETEAKLFGAVVELLVKGCDIEKVLDYYSGK